MTSAAAPGAPASSLAAVLRNLEAHGVGHELADADGTPARRLADTVAIWAHEQLVAVVLPASRRIQMQRVRQLLGDPDARLATKSELARELPGVDPDALSPFGPPAPPLVLVDRRVLSCNWVLANGGGRRHSLRVSPLGIVRLSQARVVDISSD